MESIFRHYAANESLYTETVAPVCEKHGLTFMEFTVLLFLANNPMFDTASEIVKYRHLTKSHVSLSVRSLQEKGLLRGEYHEPNRRTVHLTVLEAAEEVIREGRAAQQAYGDILFAGFTDAERELFVGFLEKIDGNVVRHGAAAQGKKECSADGRE
ncbi:MAG: MarR family transcriptional regulator [Eubacteriales bacterium]|nr:MarR family transcriptional regulator [Eubacteriales bacterium]